MCKFLVLFFISIIIFYKKSIFNKKNILTIQFEKSDQNFILDLLFIPYLFILMDATFLDTENFKIDSSAWQVQDAI